MATKFPTIIEWIEESGFSSLREEYEDFKKGDPDQKDTTFNSFVQGTYEMLKGAWEDEIYVIPKQHTIPIDMDDEGDIALESAKLVAKQILNKAIDDEEVGTIILEDELAPDHDAALWIIDDFVHRVIPAITKVLKELN